MLNRIIFSKSWFTRFHQRLPEDIHDLGDWLRCPLEQLAMLQFENVRDALFLLAEAYIALHLWSKEEIGFEIKPNPRFGRKNHAGVYAAKSIEIGHLFQWLLGVIGTLTEEEEERGDWERTGSVIWITSLNSYNILMGPARFVNHDCKSNTEVGQ